MLAIARVTIFVKHGVQANEPNTLLYVPIGQSIHFCILDASSLYWPGGQVHHATLVTATSEVVPNGHDTHNVCPALDWYVPLGHALHRPDASKPMYPGSQRQSLRASLPAAEVECSGQLTQSLREVVYEVL
eukprot:762433-Hanusia_phi.AAC.13